MKKFIARWLAAFFLTFVSFVTCAQNIQLHYDLGRNSLTSTVEMFRPDDWGSTFFFVDFDYHWKASGAYWEISRELCFWQESQMDWLSLKNIKAMENINLSVGTEMEVSCNFVEKGFRLMPTLATKWTF